MEGSEGIGGRFELGSKRYWKDPDVCFGALERSSGNFGEGCRVFPQQRYDLMGVGASTELRRVLGLS